MSSGDQTAGSLCSAARDLFKDATLGPSLFPLCRVTPCVCWPGSFVEKCHLAQAAKALSETEGGGGHMGEIICVRRCGIYLLTSEGCKWTTDKLVSK